MSVRRHRARPDPWFSEERVLAANERFARLPSTVPAGVSVLRLDTGGLSVDECRARLDAALGWGRARFELSDLRIPIGQIPVDVTLPHPAAEGTPPA